MGFVYGASVWATPQNDGFTLALNKPVEHSACKLIHVGLGRAKLVLNLALGKNFATTGLSSGDFLVAEYTYGLINARKLPAAQKYYIIGSYNHDAFLQVSGAWLNDAGFMPDTIATVAIADGRIIFSLWSDTTATYADIVKFARERKLKIIQPRKNQTRTIMDIAGHILKRAGLETSDIVGLRYEYGYIELFKPNLP